MYLNLDLLYIIKFYANLDYILFEDNFNYSLYNIVTRKTLQFTTKSSIFKEKFIYFKTIFDLNNFRMFDFEQENRIMTENDINVTYYYISKDYTISKSPINFEIPKEISDYLNSEYDNINVLKNVKKINLFLN